MTKPKTKLSNLFAAFVYVMTRKPIPDQATITICENILLRHGIDISSTRLVNQDKDLCGYAN